MPSSFFLQKSSGVKLLLQDRTLLKKKEDEYLRQAEVYWEELNKSSNFDDVLDRNSKLHHLKKMKEKLKLEKQDILAKLQAL